MVVKKQSHHIIIRITKTFEGIRINLSKLKKPVKFICKCFKLSDAIINVTIVNNTQIRKLNKKFLNRNSITDCLSFDLSDNGKNSSRLFELIVNGELALKEAELRGHPAETELALYITHGLLHNLGFNDSKPRSAKKMHQTEDKILQQLGFGPVYHTPSHTKHRTADY